MSKLDIARAYKNRSETLNMSISEIAKESGISRQTIYRILNAESNHTQLETLSKISKTLNLSIDYTLELYYLENSYQRKRINAFSFLSKKSLDSQYISLGELIDKKVEAKGTSYTALAKAIGITRQTLYRIRNEQKISSCKLDVIARLAKQLNLSIYNLLEICDQKAFFAM